ncbi:dTDP-4-dehydrorhamnose 3,5-epimerase [Parvularcula oceani]|uniref:dTDP-4-dehydrorhamnose 3,5-epimerase n=1 Tax=Parvularcula oceani TaxID=1247963 RepID=UPI00068E7DF0|nr:dTDP-4-dehydrorhamnose 3,5-epimerase [Parvularcula oceani]
MAEIRTDEVAPVKHLTPRRFGDARGWFSETFRADWPLLEAGAFVQDNHAYSAERLTVRGLHFQFGPSAQAKLLRVAAGAILDVAVDIRRGSPTFGQHVAAELTAENGEQLFVPHGFAHGYATLTEDTQVLYKVDAYYDPQREGSVRFDDPQIGIDWPEGDAKLSEKDRAAPFLKDLDTPFVYDESAPYDCRCLDRPGA